VGWRGMDWIDLADRDRWRALVNAVRTFGFFNMQESLDYLRTCYLLRKDSAPCS
jgi:hypothetical protein